MAIFAPPNAERTPLIELAQLFLKLGRSEEHTSELQSRLHLVCRLLLEKKKTINPPRPSGHRRGTSEWQTCGHRHRHQPGPIQSPSANQLHGEAVHSPQLDVLVVTSLDT